MLEALLLFEYSFKELNANNPSNGSYQLPSNFLFLAWTGTSSTTKIIASKVFYANLLAMMEKSFLQNITERDK